MGIEIDIVDDDARTRLTNVIGGIKDVHEPDMGIVEAGVGLVGRPKRTQHSFVVERGLQSLREDIGDAGSGRERCDSSKESLCFRRLRHTEIEEDLSTEIEKRRPGGGRRLERKRLSPYLSFARNDRCCTLDVFVGQTLAAADSRVSLSQGALTERACSGVFSVFFGSRGMLLGGVGG